jgi:GNAT superfamily N-acetyltransferase
VDIRIVLLSNVPHFVSTVAGWHWEAWGAGDPDSSPDSWAANLRRSSEAAGIPETWIAVAGDEPVGSVALLASDMATHPELTPWLAALYVVPTLRGRGIATALIAHCETEAAALGFGVLHLYTDSAVELYLRLGWSAIGSEWYDRGVKTVMSKDLAAHLVGPGPRLLSGG